MSANLNQAMDPYEDNDVDFKNGGGLPLHESSVETERSANIEDFHNMTLTEQQTSNEFI